MNKLKTFSALENITETFSLGTGILETTSENKLNFCSHEDDATIVQIGWAYTGGYEVDTKLASIANDIHTKMNRYLEGGCHDGITMIVLSITDEGYCIYGDDADDDCNPISLEGETVDELIAAFDKLV